MNGPENEGGKLLYDRVPVVPHRAVVARLTIGEKKYPGKNGQPNWIDGLSFASHYGALQRHANAWWGGERFDEEGLHHLSGVIANGYILMDMDLRHSGTQFDDRPPPIPESCPIK